MKLIDKSSSLLEACIIGLVIRPEQLKIFVRLNPIVGNNENTKSFTLFLKLSADCKISVIDQLTQDFISQLNGVCSSTQINLFLNSKQYNMISG